MDDICGSGKAGQDHNREYLRVCILEFFPFPSITQKEGHEFLERRACIVSNLGHAGIRVVTEEKSKTCKSEQEEIKEMTEIYLLPYPLRKDNKMRGD